MSVSATNPTLSSETVVPVIPDDLVTEPVIISSPTQEQAVRTAMADFKKEFADRIRRNDTGTLGQCFSTRSSNYDPAKIKPLRDSLRVIRPFDVASAFRMSVKQAPLEEVTQYNVLPLSYLDTGSKIEKETVPTQVVYDKDIVFIDRGHGHEVPGAKFGYDPGGIYPSPNGLQEVTVIDRVADPLTEALENKGYIVASSRDAMARHLSLLQNTSKFSSQKSALQVRAEMAIFLKQKFPNSRLVFISLHADVGGLAGSTVYYYAPLKGASTDSPESRELAKNIAASFQLRHGVNTATKSNDYAVLRCQDVSVLIELGYIDNAQDREALNDGRKIGNQIANGIDAYFHRQHYLPSVQMASNAPK